MKPLVILLFYFSSSISIAQGIGSIVHPSITEDNDGKYVTPEYSITWEYQNNQYVLAYEELNDSRKSKFYTIGTVRRLFVYGRLDNGIWKKESRTIVTGVIQENLQVDYFGSLDKKYGNSRLRVLENGYVILTLTEKIERFGKLSYTPLIFLLKYDERENYLNWDVSGAFIPLYNSNDVSFGNVKSTKIEEVNGNHYKVHLNDNNVVDIKFNYSKSGSLFLHYFDMTEIKTGLYVYKGRLKN